jgi:hypothetical protein
LSLMLRTNKLDYQGRDKHASLPDPVVNGDKKKVNNNGTRKISPSLSCLKFDFKNIRHFLMTDTIQGPML